MERMEALAQHLGITLEDEETLEDYITEDPYTENAFEAEGGTYLVLTDDEADTAARAYIQDSLWAFNADFLAGNTDLPAEVFSMIQRDRSEDANPVFYTLVTKCGDFNRLVDDAVSSDGRGHFIAGYDSEESQVGDYYIYRTH